MSETKLGCEKWRQAAKNSQAEKFRCEILFFFLLFYYYYFFFQRPIFFLIFSKIKWFDETKQ